MTPRQRLLAVLERRRPDCVPIYLRGVSPFGDRMNWMGRHHPSYERLRRLAFEGSDIIHSVGLDSGVFLSAAKTEVVESVVFEDAEWTDTETRIETPRGPLRRVLRKAKSAWFEDVIEHYIKSDDDYERFLSLPYAPPRPEVAAVVQAADREVGDRGIVAVGMPSVISFMHELLGSSLLAMWSVLERDRLRTLANLFQERMLDYVAHLLDGGAGPLFAYAGPELALPPLMSPADFREFVRDADKPIHDLVHSRGRSTWVHSHGKLDSCLEDFAEMGADILEPIEVPPGGNVSLADAKRRVGKRVILMGNMPYEALLEWPLDRIEAKVKADCAEAMEGGGFIMMPAASPFEKVLTDQGFEGFKTYVSAGRKYGRYA